jgi:hypothetical protein
MDVPADTSHTDVLDRDAIGRYRRDGFLVLPGCSIPATSSNAWPRSASSPPIPR